MKKIIYFFTICLSFCTFIPENILAQCPGCIINTGCTSNPPKPTICPETLPDGYTMQSYDQDLSFYLPHEFVDDGTGYDVTLNQLDILSVAGLPFGLSFETSASPNNIYYITSNPTTEHGCGKICGTPIMPGNYSITVSVLAHVTVFGIGQTSPSSFIIPITILPSPASNNGFSISNPFGCAPLETTYTTNRPSNGNPNYSYNWDFGNDTQSTEENPPALNYTTPGNYIVTLHTTIDTLPYYLQSLTINSSSCDDAIWSDPDYFFNLKQGSTTIYSAPYIDNTEAPVTFSFSPIELNNATYTIEIREYDEGILGADDVCGDYNFQGHTAGTFTLSASGGDGNSNITFTVSHPVLNFDDVDTIKVFQPPIIGAYSFVPNDSVCDKDSIFLSVSAAYGSSYQWYNDTNVINGATELSYWAKASGDYWVEVSNENGCRTNSNMQTLTFIPNPPKPGTWVTGNTLNTNLAGYDMQWYYEDSPINGATGLTYDYTASGNYFVMATNFFGCATSSDTVYVTYSSGLAETNTLNGIQLIPNPTTGKFIVSFDANTADDIQIVVSDITGRVVYQNIYSGLNGRFLQEIDLSMVQKGIYIVEIVSGNSRTNSKLIKQ
ncbi:MAG: T9SS type A sorting domain-containing protein [Bacteroidales bacterium]|jgi:hypothetical protein|nr:T9SS type A sorting domain-containing protein [Bacteroidales bacterium]MDD4213749.1 T9SS type A sorting domain-containing protein [Bacteroidales bacterium]